ncbi:MAG: sigma 54-interacting transcriptional regulator [Blastocatellia bacterium]|nr:sigma 54-interacting transcriptional regulator [Blastocatellia bacterium]
MEKEKASRIEFDEASIDQMPTIAIDPRRARYLGAEQALPDRAGDPRVSIETRKLLRMALELIALREMEPLSEKVREFLRDLTPAEFGALLIYDENASGGAEWERGPLWHVSGGAIRESDGFRISRSALERVRTERQAVLINPPLEGEPSLLAESVAHSGIRSLLVAPLLSRQERLLGAIHLSQSNPAIRFSEEHLELTMAIAELAAKSLENILQFRQIENDRIRLREAIDPDRVMIGETPPMMEVREFIARVSDTDATILIQGESGTGKELVARAIHENSPRKERPFIAINCANLGEALLESELFGHERGAFTGAHATKKGKLEYAEGGTVFLDEIGELAPQLQAKLLRVLQEREMERLGGAKTIKLDIRVIAATNRDLNQAIAEKAFRADLFYRLSAVQTTLPRLSERRDDIPLIATSLINEFARKHRRPANGLSRAARERLVNYDWPGNVRELRNVIENAVIFCELDLIQPEDLPDSLFETRENTAPLPGARSPIVIQEVLPYRDAVKEARRQIVLRAFEVAEGNHQEAARLLGLHPNNLHRETRNLKLKSLVKKPA